MYITAAANRTWSGQINNVIIKYTGKELCYVSVIRVSVKTDITEYNKNVIIK